MDSRQIEHSSSDPELRTNFIFSINFLRSSSGVPFPEYTYIKNIQEKCYRAGPLAKYNIQALQCTIRYLPMLLLRK